VNPRVTVRANNHQVFARVVVAITILVVNDQHLRIRQPAYFALSIHLSDQLVSNFVQGRKIIRPEKVAHTFGGTEMMLVSRKV
jgi:hypothetical protein